MLKHIWTVLSKETRDNLRDRRTIFNSLFTVLFNPLLYIVLFGFLNRTFSDQIERPLELAIVGGENAPRLVEYLEQNNVVLLPTPDDPRTAVREGDLDVVLIIPDEFAENFEEGFPAPVQLVRDLSRANDIAGERAQDLLQQYSSRIGGLRLLARGVSPALLAAIPVETINVTAERDAAAGVVLNLLPVVMITAAFFGGFYLAVDLTAGERERESLEPLLINPVPRSQVLAGKYLTAFLFTILAIFLGTTTFLVLLGIPLVQEFTGFYINLGFDVIITAVLLMIPVAFMAVALEVLVASYSETVKEAQTYTQIVALVGFLPSVFLSVLPIKEQPWMTYIPTVSQLYLINEVSQGDALDPVQVVLASSITIMVGLLALIAAQRLFSTERIILGK
jgi:sodium transport system permease protein